MSTATDLNICRLAQSEGREYFSVAQALQGEGKIDALDPRASGLIMEPWSRLDDSPKAALTEMQYYHAKTRELPDVVTPRAALAGTLALQDKMLRALSCGCPPDGFEAATAGITFEEAGRHLMHADGTRRIARKLFGIAARTTDRATLAERHAGFKSLVSDVVANSGLTWQDTARGLYRSGHLDPGDPRLEINLQRIGEANALDTAGFLTHVRALFDDACPRIRPCDDPAFGFAAIKTRLSAMRRYHSNGEQGANAIERHRGIMYSVAQICEAMAIHLHQQRGGVREDRAGRLLAGATSASIRGQIFGDRLRNQQRRSGLRSAERHAPTLN